jgi:hypothetical protein
LVERIPQQEWLICGFPTGGTDISGAEAGRFISAIVRSLMQGRFVYVTGQVPLEVAHRLMPGNAQQLVAYAWGTEAARDAKCEWRAARTGAT